MWNLKNTLGKSYILKHITLDSFLAPTPFLFSAVNFSINKLLIFGTMYEEVRKPEQIFKFSIQMLCNSLCITQNILILQNNHQNNLGIVLVYQNH